MNDSKETTLEERIQRCAVGSCKRHQVCMYTPCRAIFGAVMTEGGTLRFIANTTERGTLHCRCDPRGEEMCLVKTSLADRLCGYLCQRLVSKQESARAERHS